MRSKESPNYTKSRIEGLKLSTSYRKSMSLNLFPATDLRPEVELMQLLHMLLCADIIVMFETGGTGQTASSL